MDDAPAQVSIVHSEAAREDRDAFVRWTVSGEDAAQAGFHVYRETAGGTRVRLTDEPLTGSTAYEFEDAAPPDTTADYWLAEMRGSRLMGWRGPVRLEARRFRLSVRAIQPNPFRESVRIHFEVPAAGPVRLRIFDVSGRQVAIVAQEEVQPGDRTMEWDGEASSGGRTGSGVYFYRLETTVGSRSGKVVRLR
jgi:hypothetical protein